VSSPAAPAVAPDGQQVVDQPIGVDHERAEIQAAADHQEKMSQAEREGTPSVRFWDSRRAQAGPLMALIAGLFTLAVRTWPIAVPQGRGSPGVGWFLGATVVGALYIAGFFLADRHSRRARSLLIIGGVAHLIIGFASGALVEAHGFAPAPSALFFDLVPAVVALIAAFLIVPPPEPSRD
jgi:hypothetical protein